VLYRNLEHAEPHAEAIGVPRVTRSHVASNCRGGKPIG
jgi:hypothetical protein